MPNELSINNVVTVSLAAAQSGLSDYNVNNLAILTDESTNESFGSLGYKTYLNASEVATDFGSDSDTYKMATSVFAQSPNILNGGGYLAVIKYADGVAAKGTATFSANPTANDTITIGSTTLTFKATASVSTDVAIGETLAETLQNLVAKTITGVALSYSNEGVLTIEATELGTSGNSIALAKSSTAITLSGATLEGGSATESTAQAIQRAEGLVPFFAVISQRNLGAEEIEAAAAYVQTVNKEFGYVLTDDAQLQAGGLFKHLTELKYNKSRGLFYSDSTYAFNYLAAYFGRYLSTEFEGSNTVQTMHLKDLVGIPADPGLTQTLLNLAKDNGADCYANIAGVAKVFCSGANGFADQVYNLAWLVGKLEVAGFNVLATVSNKVPQTEAGMDILKGAYRLVLDQAVRNGYLAPGKWTRVDKFGDVAAFDQNVEQVGYYIYSAPVSQQSVSDRAARKAPLVQIAAKEAGAIHSTSILLYVNA